MEDIGRFEEVPKEKIHPNPWNPNIMTDEEKNRLNTSMERNGFLQTVLLYKESDDSYMVLDGEHRWSAARDGSNVRSIVVDDKDLAAIKKNLQEKEGTQVDNKEDLLKHLTVVLNKLKGTMTPTKLGELIDSLELDKASKAEFMLMDQQEMEFYSLVEEIEDEKTRIHEKEFGQDQGQVVKWRVKDVEGLHGVAMDLGNSKFYVDGEEKELESLTMTVNGKLKAVLNCRYKDIKEDGPEGEESTDDREGQAEEATVEESSGEGTAPTEDG